MAKFFEFPTADIRNWISIEKATREALLSAGNDRPACDFVLDRLKVDYAEIEASFDISAPTECKNRMQETIQFFQARINAAYLRLIRSHLDLYADMMRGRPTR